MMKKNLLFLALVILSFLVLIVCSVFDNYVIGIAFFIAGICDAFRIINGKESFDIKFTKESGEIRYGSKSNKLPEYEDVKYFRDIPFKDDLFMAYWVCLKYDIVPEPELKKGLMQAIILKWVVEEKIKIVKANADLTSFIDDNYAIDINNLKKLTNPAEKYFSQLLMAISGHNQILEANEFEKWCYHNSGKLDGWFFFARYTGQQNLKKAGYIKTSTEKIKSKGRNMQTIVVNNVSDDLWYEALKIKGLKKFLLYFTSMNEKEYADVHLWESYLIFSSLLGVSNKIESQFANLYPKIAGETAYSIDTILCGIGIAEMGYVSFEKGTNGNENQVSSENQKDHKNQ